MEGSLSEPECSFVNSMLGTADHSCHPSAQEAETGGFLRVPGQAGIYIESETLPKNKISPMLSFIYLFSVWGGFVCHGSFCAAPLTGTLTHD